MVCIATVPAAPGLFSTKTGTPNSFCNFSAIDRAIISEALPAVAPEINLIGLLGKVWLEPFKGVNPRPILNSKT